MFKVCKLFQKECSLIVLVLSIMFGSGCAFVSTVVEINRQNKHADKVLAKYGGYNRHIFSSFYDSKTDYKEYVLKNMNHRNSVYIKFDNFLTKGYIKYDKEQDKIYVVNPFFECETTWLEVAEHLECISIYIEVEPKVLWTSNRKQWCSTCNKTVNMKFVVYGEDKRSCKCEKCKNVYFWHPGNDSFVPGFYRYQFFEIFEWEKSNDWWNGNRNSQN